MDSTSVETTAGPPTSSDETRKKGGLEPEEFRKRLFAVTAVVLMLGALGGTCLGSKIQQAEKTQAETTGASQPATTPSSEDSTR